jgi:hypothetical protein
MWCQVKNYLFSSIGFYTGLFVLLMLGAWVANAMLSTKFDIKQLQEIYLWLMTQLNATHAINSIFNSARGEKPQ